jgi:hypothetical protein
MRLVLAVGLMCIGVAGCSTSGAPQMPEPAKPQLVGPVASQPGNCFFKDASGKVFISPCPR